MSVVKQRVLVVGLGTMGTSHARAYQAIDGFELVGLCTRNAAGRRDLDRDFAGVPRYDDLGEALAALKPDAVAIAAYTEHHAPMALKALEAGAHVFCEKPLADTLAAAEAIVAAAKAAGKALLVGYILRVHPSWTRFVEIGRTLGKPLVMRMNLNQQSSGSFWEVHKNLMTSTSPIVDCGVHYVDVMCQVTRARPVAVHAVGARLTDEIAPTMVNYGHLHIVFDDGSVGWYEAGWGPVKKYVVKLSAEERKRLEAQIHVGKSSARMLTRARILLKADVSDAGGGWSDSAISAALDTSVNNVARTRQQLVEEGFEATLSRKSNPNSARRRIFDGAAEAKLIALACSPAPEGFARWTLRLLEEKVVELNIVEKASDNTIGRTLKKTSLNRTAIGNG